MNKPLGKYIQKKLNSNITRCEEDKLVGLIRHNNIAKLNDIIFILTSEISSRNLSISLTVVTFAKVIPKFGSNQINISKGISLNTLGFPST